ncbi:MAG: hypothetical protein DMG72_14190 [Acidobacteria bacterium]|nr:MAG: hypothetical protein DMG72_14190 [Acidobacteriota bacterium]
MAHNNGGGELGQRFRLRFFLAMEIVSGGIQGEFAQQERVLHRQTGSYNAKQVNPASPYQIPGAGLFFPPFALHLKSLHAQGWTADQSLVLHRTV